MTMDLGLSCPCLFPCDSQAQLHLPGPSNMHFAASGKCHGYCDVTEVLHNPKVPGALTLNDVDIARLQNLRKMNLNSQS